MSSSSRKRDWLLISTTSILLISIAHHFFHIAYFDTVSYATPFANFVTMMLKKIWWGVLLGILSIGILSQVPRQMVMRLLGTHRGITGILRATLFGVLFDLCSHGILMVGAKLYERGASSGQVIAFLVASPWNSLSLTLILIGLIGLKWTLLFIALSMLVAIITGITFNIGEKQGWVPPNPHQNHQPIDTDASASTPHRILSLTMLTKIIIEGFVGAKMLLRWLFLGVIIAGLLTLFFTPEQFELAFGPTLLGLGLTLGFATVLEVCSEGSTPIAAEIFNQGGAPGNAFAFLMAGVSTDYTEYLILKEATKTWRIPILLTLITLPQIIIVGLLLNHYAT